MKAQKGSVSADEILTKKFAIVRSKTDSRTMIAHDAPVERELYDDPVSCSGPACYLGQVLPVFGISKRPGTKNDKITMLMLSAPPPREVTDQVEQPENS
jgi:hypothetical protein